MSHQLIMEKWAIPTSELTNPRRTGGRTTIRGFAFQDAYACLQLTRLLAPRQELIAVRYEGAQDIDLCYAHGIEKYVQLKNEPDARYTLNKLAPVLQGFAADLFEAGTPHTLTFTLVARSNSLDAAVTRLRDGNHTTNDVEAVAALLGQHSAPESLTALSNSDLHTLTEQLVKQIEFRFGMGDETDGRISFAAHAYARLAEHGVAAPDLGNAFNALKTALIPQREFTCSDVHDILKRFIGGAAIDIFDERAQALTDELLATRANGKRIQQYYAGAPLDWDIIAAHGDIPRDQQVALIAKLLQPTDSLRLFCIVAEPGAGKSTLAWRVATKLHRRHGAFVIRLRDREEPECWYQMEEFYRRVNRPFYVLADDLFRSPDVVSALCELSPSLPITVLATSRKNEYRLPRFKGELVREDLKQPSKEEKERVLERLGKSRNELTPEQQSRLDGANQFIVLMMELTAGKELSEIVRDAVERLKEQDQSAYRAYEYLCFAYQHSVSIPESLLERLDDQGRFHRLPARETTQGLIFYDDERGGHVRVGHPVIAETATSFYEAWRSPIAVLRESVKAVNLTMELERRFIARLLRAQAKTQSTSLQLVFQEIEAFFTTLQQDARIGELTIWRDFFRLLGQQRQSAQCVDLALTRPPADSNDCNLLINLYRERGRERDALPLLAEWIRQNPDSHGARPGYLSVVERNCKEDEIGAAINETGAWLADPPQDYSVRSKYLGLVERKGTAEQVKQAVAQTSAGLKDHSQDHYVRTAYLGLVERKGTAEQVTQVVAETSAWLKDHLQDTYVRTAYLGLVKRKGTAEQVKQVVAETSAWLIDHLQDSSVRTAYIGLVERKGTAEQVKQVVAETSAWLQDHPQNCSVRGKYLGLVERKGTAEQVKQVVAETSAWLVQHPKAVGVRERYIGLVERKGTPEQFGRAVQEVREWLWKHTSADAVWNALIASLIRLGKTEEAAEVALEAISHHPEDRNLVIQQLRLFSELEDEQVVRWLYEKLLESVPKDVNIVTHYANWLRDHGYHDEARAKYLSLIARTSGNFKAHYGYGRLLLSLSEFKQSAEQFRKTIGIRIGHQMAHDGLAQALNEMGTIAEQKNQKKEANRYFTEAEREFRQAIYWAEMSNQPQAIFFTNLGWFYVDRRRYATAIEAFDAALNEGLEFFGNYWGIGRAKMEQGQFEEAVNYLRIALEKAPEDFQPPASEEIPKLLQQCEEALNMSNAEAS